MRNDEIQIEILEDGTIKVSTDEVSGPNHANAEAFLAMMARDLGGETTIEKKRHTHTHVHAHVHIEGGN